MENIRENGRVKKWNEKGFGFIDRSDGTSVFCHARETPGRVGLTAGSMVSYVYEFDEKGGKAVQVRIEEAVEESSAIREMGTVKRWNAEKGFGFIGRTSGGDDAFVHKKDHGGKDLAVGQPVSFVFEQGTKGASAKAVKEEGEITVEKDEGIRELGKVKQYNEDKGFAFIGRCTGGDDLFAHRKEFGSVVPYAGQPVSFLVEDTEKGAAAKKIREEESVPELPISDEGRAFGTIRDFNTEKGFGFVIPRNGGDNARFFDKACKNLTPGKGMCVSFVLEDTEKGLTAKDLREEDPERVARVTAKVHYGKVKQYFDPTDKKPTNGYGFIEPRDAPSYGAPKKYFFHMDEIVTPDKDGGLDPGAHVSFIVVPAKKGIQAAAVTVVDPPEEKKKEEVKKENVPMKPFEDPFAVADSFAEMKVTNENKGTAIAAPADPPAADDDWGAAPSW